MKRESHVQFCERPGVQFPRPTLLKVSLHILRRHQANFVSELRQLPRPIMRRGTGFHADQARRQRLEKRNHLAASKLLSHNNLLLGIDAVDLEYVLGDIQTDRGNLHLDGSPHVICLRRSLMALRCRERAPSTTPLADETGLPKQLAG